MYEYKCKQFILPVFPVLHHQLGETSGPRSTQGAGISGAWTVNIVMCVRLVDSPSHPLLLSSCNVGMSPKVLWNRLVAAMKRNSACRVFDIVSSFVMLMSLPPVLLRKICLAAWCAGQCSMRCSTVSSCCRHAGHIGESAFPIRCKCLASGACPVLNCVKMLAAFLGRAAIRVRYLFDMAVGSVFFIHSCRGDFHHIFCARRLSFSPYAHFIADLLRGIVFFRSRGSSSWLLLPSVIAFFASSSARSLPSIPLCPGVHLIAIRIPGCFFLSVSRVPWNASIM
jgi:hypothetical protein